jgi:hypothetical protein
MLRSSLARSLTALVLSLLGSSFLPSLTLSPLNVLAAEFSLQQHEKGVAIKLDGEPFTEYVIRSGSKPILWPIIGPTGAQMTRSYPMQDVEGEKRDHVHQRSLWFTHGEVNGIDFWAEPATYAAGKRPPNKRLGTIVHREFVKLAAQGSRAEIVTTNDWLDEEGRKQCEDQRSLVFSVSDNARLVDFDVVLRATDGAVEFGDTKEGSLGVRVPTAIDVKDASGHIINSEGMKDKAAWGKRARWVDYYGPIEGQVVGIAILNHPSSFRHPTYWHVRDYGLFAANPFGVHDFEPNSEQKGGFTLPAGQTIRLRHRLIFHRGDAEGAHIAEAYERYAAEKP